LNKKSESVDQASVKAMAQLKDQIAGIDLAASAQRVGGRFINDKLTLKILGKDFSVDSQGNLSSEIHINPWLAIPVLNFVLRGKGEPLTEVWGSYRELKGGKEGYGLFAQQCEKPLKRVEDNLPRESIYALCTGMVRMFEKIVLRHGALCIT
jgi:hypothetical protein